MHESAGTAMSSLHLAFSSDHVNRVFLKGSKVMILCVIAEVPAALVY